MDFLRVTLRDQPVLHSWLLGEVPSQPLQPKTATPHTAVRHTAPVRHKKRSGTKNGHKTKRQSDLPSHTTHLANPVPKQRGTIASKVIKPADHPSQDLVRAVPATEKLPQQPKKKAEPTLDELREQWKREQLELKAQLIERDDLPFVWDPTGRQTTLRRVGGVDITWVKDTSKCVASLVVVSYPELEVLHEAYDTFTVSVPYMPGFLAFREVAPLCTLLDGLRSRPDLMPEIILVDGNGVLHYRGFGLASHFGVVAGIPTIGVAKHLLNVDGLETRHHTVLQQGRRGQKIVPMPGNSGRVWGNSFFWDTQGDPTYISIGHRISLETATDIVVKCSIQRVPEPVRQADILSREHVREIEEGPTEQVQLEGPLEEVQGTVIGFKRGSIVIKTDTGVTFLLPRVRVETLDDCRLLRCRLGLTGQHRDGGFTAVRCVQLTLGERETK